MSAVQSTAADAVILGCAAQHPGDRPEQQDRVAILRGRRAPRCALALLADGLGGRSGGSLAAEQAMTSARRLFDEFGPTDPPERFFEDLVHEVHVVLQLAGTTSGLEPHTTLAAALVQPDRVDWCHIGDSRVYHLRDGTVVARTLDDSYAQQLLNEGRLAPEQARRHPSGQRLTQALGGSRRPHPTVAGMRRPTDADAFLLCSDGLWNHVEDEEIATEACGHPAREAAARLIALARERARGVGDNCSLVVVRLAPHDA